MASIHKERRGKKTVYRLQFYDKDNHRRSMRLGSINKKAAETIRAKVEDLVSASISGGLPSKSTLDWLQKELGDDLAGKLKKVGFGSFIPQRESARLGDFVRTFVDIHKSDWSPLTVSSFGQVETKLVEFFGRDRDLKSISEDEARAWRNWLLARHAEATANKHIKRARQIFKLAVKRGAAIENPFDEVEAGSEVNEDRQFTVERPTVDKILEACPNAEWRLIIALSRFGGLRTPSETLLLSWADIDWANDRIKVWSPKTKKKGKPSRIIPIFPELRLPLTEAFELAPEGAEFVIQRYRDKNSNLRTQFNRILRKAGVEPWPRLFHNMRATRETELVKQFPIHVATAWIGNSPTIALKHYLRVTEDDFQKAIGNTSSMGATVGAVNDGLGMPGVDSKSPITGKSTGIEEFLDAFKLYQQPDQDSNLEHLVRSET